LVPIIITHNACVTKTLHVEQRFSVRKILRRIGGEIKRFDFQLHKYFSSLMKINVMRLKFEMHSLHFSEVLSFFVLGSLGWTVVMMSNSMLSTTNNVLDRLLKPLVPETVDDEITKRVAQQEDCCNPSCNNYSRWRFRKSIRSIKQSKTRLTKSELSDNIQKSLLNCPKLLQNANYEVTCWKNLKRIARNVIVCQLPFRHSPPIHFIWNLWRRTGVS